MPYMFNFLINIAEDADAFALGITRKMISEFLHDQFEDYNEKECDNIMMEDTLFGINLLGIVGYEQLSLTIGKFKLKFSIYNRNRCLQLCCNVNQETSDFLIDFLRCKNIVFSFNWQEV